MRFRILKCARHMLLPLCLALLVSGCGQSPYMDEDAGPDSALVFGHINMVEAPVGLQWVSLKQTRPETGRPYFNFWVREGDFYSHYIPFGEFQFDSFGGQKKETKVNWVYRFPNSTQRPPNLTIRRPGLYYAGSWKYKRVTREFSKPGEFYLVKEENVSEREILKRMLPWLRHKKYKDMVETRIRQLGD